MQRALTTSFFLVSFLSAFLLFLVQPMATKAILPILGGAPAVWNTAMVCFQLLLLGGYLYAHAIARLRSARLQWLAHAVLLALSFWQLPIAFHHLNSESAVAQPVLWTLATLLFGIGLPFFALSATAPLLQHWVSRSDSPLAHEPYRLYSISNTGSMLALIGYLFLVEPNFDLPQQHRLWSLLYLCFAVLMLLVGFRLGRSITPHEQTSTPPTARERLLWVAIAFLPSSLMLGVTTYITTDIASVPLLWIIPLVIYLASFIAAFGHSGITRTAHRHAYILLICFALTFIGFKLSNLLVLVHFLGLAIACFALHGQLAERKPAPAYLTQFYICLSFGGVLGGMFNALVAPLIFTGTTEYPLALAAATLMLFSLHPKGRTQMSRLLQHGWILCALIVGTTAITLAVISLFPALEHEAAATFATIAMASCLLCVFLIKSEDTRRLIALMAGVLPVCGYLIVLLAITDQAGNTLTEARNFFGTVRVKHDPKADAHILLYNTTVHGIEPWTQKDKPQLTAYYRDTLGEVTSIYSKSTKPIAVIGLGAGTTQCVAAPKQTIDFYDINRAVIDIASNPDYFTFLQNCPGKHELILGDGRLMIAKATDARYGVIVVDAFSSDAIPVHMLTQEALAIYKTKLAPGGVILFHVTNRFFNLPPLLALQANAMGWTALTREFVVDQSPSPIFKSRWVVLAPDTNTLKPLLAHDSAWHAPGTLEGKRPWTDAYSDILPYIHLID